VTTPYRRGADFERLIQERLGLLGYVTIRAAGSRGAADVWAAKAPNGLTRLLVVQCKAEGALLTAAGKRRLVNLALCVGATPCLAEQRPGSGVWITDVQTGAEIE